ncbi:hypothetical protein EZY14_000905 [Kordia sp. TARA_039_SRF]|nr:hypothetical protein EZY14_000905 [Kordia sp. TARA_039_SRF]
MKTKIFLPVVAMFCLMLTSFTAQANSKVDSTAENTSYHQEVQNTENAIFTDTVANANELDSEDALRIRITIRFRRIEIVIEIGFFSMDGGSGDVEALENSQLDGNIEGNNLIVNGFEGVDGSIIEVSENQPFETETGVVEILPGVYEINEGRAVFNVHQMGE